MKLWMIGCGNMAGAMLRRWLAAGTLSPADVFVVTRSDRPLPGDVAQGRRLPDGAADVLMLGVKPQQLREAAADHAEAGGRAGVLLSILAGVEADTLHDLFPGPEPVAAMPNLPVEIGAGVIPLKAGPDLSAGARAAVDALMRPLGLPVWDLEPAAWTALAALTGCGPAFLFRVIDAYAKAGAAAGAPPELALDAARRTVAGAAAMALASDASPATLADRVASPGGMTRQGLDVLDRDGALDELLTETLQAALRRGAELTAASRG